jgi:hypothetical protein
MRRRYWIVLAVVAVAVAAAGGALAATKLQSPSDRSKAVINDAAHRLNVSPSALSSALRKALEDQVDAAVAAGRLTKKQGDAIKARIAAGPLPLVGGFGYGFGGGRGFHFPEGRLGRPDMLPAGLGAVTSYLGITAAQLRSALASGKSLAQIAKNHGKTADGLVAVLVATAKGRLDRAVKAGHLSAKQERAILSRLRTMFESLVNRTPPKGFRSRPPYGFGFGFHRNHPLGPRAGGHFHLGPPAVAKPTL